MLHVWRKRLDLRRSVGNLVLAAASLLVSLAAAELAFRLWGYRFSPIVFLTPENEGDWRAFHMGANDPRLAASEPLTVFDDDLLWRLNPAVSAEVNAQGYRGPLLPEKKEPLEYRIVAVGDSNTIGSLHSNDHWPGFLDDLVRKDASRRARVVNAGVYGYTSFQGLRRVRQALHQRPDLVLFSFGVNDAQPVDTSDAAYAGRVGWLRSWQWSRVAPPLAHLWLKLSASMSAPRPRTHRVPLAEYRRNLEAFVDLARANEVTPVLLTRPWVGRSEDPDNCLTAAPQYNEMTRQVAAEKGVLLVDAYHEFEDCAELFTDPIHFNRLGNRRMAEFVLRRLESLQVVKGVDGFASGPAIAFTEPDDRRPELGPGFWSFEAVSGSDPGRWTSDVGTLTLTRTKHERGLALDLSMRNPRPLTSGRVEVNGRTVFDFTTRQGRARPVLDIGDVAGSTLEVRFVTDPAYVPREHEPGNNDARRLGVFVHGARLVDAPFASGVDLADLDADSPELREGWFDAETWPDGRRGRWTSARAELVLERIAREDTLVVDASFQNARNRTSGVIEVDGRVLGRFEGPNGRHEQAFHLEGSSGRRVRVRLRVEQPFVPRRDKPGTSDERVLGMFVHSVRLVDQPRTRSTTREPSGQGQERTSR